jgi:hypothetical protein
MLPHLQSFIVFKEFNPIDAKTEADAKEHLEFTDVILLLNSSKDIRRLHL